MVTSPGASLKEFLALRLRLTLKATALASTAEPTSPCCLNLRYNHRPRVSTTICNTITAITTLSYSPLIRTSRTYQIIPQIIPTLLKLSTDNMTLIKADEGKPKSKGTDILPQQGKAMHFGSQRRF
ncbi:hypothetical protein J6590_079073 [Homalodisca vitripennis]|nr:hypothetical protein J6590_079073 [Homalodisca vitripennis]